MNILKDTVSPRRYPFSFYPDWETTCLQLCVEFQCQSSQSDCRTLGLYLNFILWHIYIKTRWTEDELPACSLGALLFSALLCCAVLCSAGPGPSSRALLCCVLSCNILLPPPLLPPRMMASYLRDCKKSYVVSKMTCVLCKINVRMYLLSNVPPVRLPAFDRFIIRNNLKQ